MYMSNILKHAKSNRLTIDTSADISVDYRPTIGRLSVDSGPTIGQ